MDKETAAHLERGVQEAVKRGLKEAAEGNLTDGPDLDADAADLALIRMREGESNIPWEQVLRELGLEDSDMPKPQPLWEAFRRLVDAINLVSYGPSGNRIISRRIDRMRKEIEKVTKQMTELRANWFEKVMNYIRKDHDDEC